MGVFFKNLDIFCITENLVITEFESIPIFLYIFWTELSFFFVVIWFGLVFHVSAGPSTPSFSWVLCHLLLYVSLTFRCPDKQTTQIVQTSEAPSSQTRSPHKGAGTLVPRGRGSLLLHFLPIVFQLRTLGAQPVRKWDARDKRSDSFCSVLTVHRSSKSSLRGFLLPNPALLGNLLAFPHSLF